ncbi:mitotic spindle assembly checkpoint protein mad2a [Anaeramoeba ignava]|uniref:Mitotic spindle assembly checkpoint protein mad2a n=1 Tax=Anaeramoeba ignava TaxID=1746090 RepID=A0A9Q0LST0_ANAIG|nr:mitotic spindle assembly checkpoint protein mad2a [Anaeramoeba ignava]
MKFFFMSSLMFNLLHILKLIQANRSNLKQFLQSNSQKLNFQILEKIFQFHSKIILQTKFFCSDLEDDFPILGEKQATKNPITLRGSTEIVTEFFNYSINNILFMRGIYPVESFKSINKYGLTIQTTTDEELQNYLSQVLQQLSQWLMKHQVKSLVLVLTNVITKEVMERWVFNIECDKAMTEDSKPKQKSETEIRLEIQAIIRQIMASVSILPLLVDPCTFDLLIYTDDDIEIPKAWEESDPKFITNSQEIKLRSFTTKIHKVDTYISYKFEK